MAAPAVTRQPVRFDDLPHWADDDHRSAFEALVAGAEAVLRTYRAGQELSAIYRAVLDPTLDMTGTHAARSFFEAKFVPHQILHDQPTGLLTGYYEPVLDGAAERGGRFTVALYRRPADLENVVSEADRGAKSALGLTHIRRRPDGMAEPYSTREDIETGALDGQQLEFMWLDDPVEAFMLHVQGSGAIRLRDGGLTRVTYDGKNGHPYTSVGRVMIDQGLFSADELTLQGMTDWLKRNPEQARTLLWHNKSFVFFKPHDGDAPVGVLGSPLQPGRSIAVDTAFHSLGTPLYVSAPAMTHVKPSGFHRLMIAHDVGSAIRGPERGDIYFGTGPEALALAGITKHAANVFVLLPREGAP